MKTEYAARVYRQTDGTWAIDVRANGVHIAVLGLPPDRDDVEAVVVEYLQRCYARPKDPRVQVSFPDRQPSRDSESATESQEKP